MPRVSCAVLRRDHFRVRRQTWTGFPCRPHQNARDTQQTSSSSVLLSLSFSRRCKGDYGFNVFHNSNPQHGGSYARHERRMREDEVEDFLKSVKGWTPVWGTPPPSNHLPYVLATASTPRRGVAAAKGETGEEGGGSGAPPPSQRTSATLTRPASSARAREALPVSSRHGENCGTTLSLEEGGNPYASASATDATRPPEPSLLSFGDEAIMKTFSFPSFGEAYLFMGRLWAFCYGSDKYPQVLWNRTEITVYLYSPSFKGLSKREARLAAFLNDQFNMFKKSREQREKVMKSVIEVATVEEVVGEEVRLALAAREAQRKAKVAEAVVGPQRWSELLPKMEEEEPVMGDEAVKRDGDL